MSDSLNVQQNIKKNAEEVQQFFSDMKTWETEIKEKEMHLKRAKGSEPNLPLPRNVVDKKEAPSTSGKKLKNDTGVNYQNIDEAFFEKELGNKFVMEQKWTDAINCYTKAIALDSKNAVYHANRSLCYIKINKWKLAEVDSTVAIQLDATYVKAYKRRAFVRKTMNHDKGAREDYERVLILEPGCVEATQEIAELDKRLETAAANKSKPAQFNYKNIFATSEPAKKPKVENLNVPKKVQIVSTEDVAMNLEPTLNDRDFVSITAISKPTHLRSKKPLLKTFVRQVEGRGAAMEYLERICISSAEKSVDGKKDVALEINKAGPSVTREVQTKSRPVAEETAATLDVIPKTYVQFVAIWRRILPNHMLRYELLKRLVGDLATVFGSWLEIDVLSDIIAEVTNSFLIKDPELTFGLLKNLTHVERFQSLLLFLTSEDEKRLKDIFKELDQHCPACDVNELRSLFGF